RIPTAFVVSERVPSFWFDFLAASAPWIRDRFSLGGRVCTRGKTSSPPAPLLVTCGVQRAPVEAFEPEELFDLGRRALACASVPKRRHRAGDRGGQHVCDVGETLRLETEELIRSEANRDRTFRVLPKREARDAEHRRLLLYTA